MSKSKIEEIQKEFEQAYSGKEEKFKTALLEARDDVGFLLTRAVNQLSRHNLLFFNVANALLKADREIAKETSRESYQEIIRSCFKWRGVKQPYPPLAMI
jgi:hypothetical protein